MRNKSVAAMPWGMDVITRAAAKRLGLRRYFTNRSCKRGHVSERYVSGGQCAVCKNQQHREWRVANPEYAREETRLAMERWRKRNRDHYIPARHARRASDADAPGGGIDLRDWVRLRTAFDGRCAYCDADVGDAGLTLDHVVPLSSGGANDVSNCVPACGRCNSSKCGKDVTVWFRVKFRYEWSVRKAVLPCL